jgi:hypothetical protein
LADARWVAEKYPGKLLFWNDSRNDINLKNVKSSRATGQRRRHNGSGLF